MLVSNQEELTKRWQHIHKNYTTIARKEKYIKKKQEAQKSVQFSILSFLLPTPGKRIHPHIKYYKFLMGKSIKKSYTLECVNEPPW